MEFDDCSCRPAGQDGGEVGVDRHLQPLLLYQPLLRGGCEEGVVNLSKPRF